MPPWNQIYTILRSQAEKIHNSGFKPDVIVGITRGGWVPARILPDLLGIYTLATIRVEFYVGVAETKNEFVLTQSVSAYVTGKETLLVDDMADTGKSLQLVTEHLQNQGATEVRVSMLYYKPSNLFTPHFYEKKTRRWVIFLLNTKEVVMKILENRGENSVNVEVTKLVNAGLLKRLMEELLKETVEAEKC
ncbi:hypothetical protein AC478_01155 [miscellaneous Crenarchaeota group-1 archaeon SG8-32-3]|uniref:Phosphoribosyltransferase domain-containing protein n=1 Tax=miscellaneous Crenarchaeota group-1 archaeon SG8-32-3 TaxID=1685125 RepID=A0A0M0BUV5_9ARCH|nr:MAG: hypothetical protein AC478_01155 [miscellaneous Crenarchaeota group-1 archaeon SG8-32-3]